MAFVYVHAASTSAYTTAVLDPTITNVKQIGGLNH